MHLAEYVREQLRAFVDGKLSADDLSDLLDGVAPEVHAADDASLRVLTDRVFSLLAEARYGDRDLDEARREVVTALQQPVSRAS